MYLRHCGRINGCQAVAQKLLGSGGHVGVLALLSKSMAVTLPVVLLVLDAYPLRRLRPGIHGWATPGPWRIWREGPFVHGGARQCGGVSGAPELCASDVVGAPRSTGADCRFRVFARVLPAKDTASAELSPLYEPPPCTPSIGAFSRKTNKSAMRQRWPGLLGGLDSYGVMLFPWLESFTEGHQIAADRYTPLYFGYRLGLTPRRRRRARFRNTGVVGPVAGCWRVAPVFSAIPFASASRRGDR